MVTQWWIEYWWIPVTAISVMALLVLAWALARRGTFARTWPKITLAFACVSILLIPGMPSPASYFLAVIVICNIVILFMRLLDVEKSSSARESVRPSNPAGATAE